MEDGLKNWPFPMNPASGESFSLPPSLVRHFPTMTVPCIAAWIEQ